MEADAKLDHATAPKRFALRLSVRMFMMLVLLVGAWMGWLARQAERQRQAVARIERAGGRVYYDWYYAGGTISGAESGADGPNVPHFLVKLLGPDFFGTVISAQFEACGTDEILADVAKLDGLEQLSLFMSGVTDNGMRRIAGLAHLQELNLQNSAVGDAGLKHLESLPRLRMLTLPNQVTDAGLARVATMGGLRTVFIHRQQCCQFLADESVERLRRERPDLEIDPP